MSHIILILNWLKYFRTYEKLTLTRGKSPGMHTAFFAFCLENIEESDLNSMILSKTGFDIF